MTNQILVARPNAFIVKDMKQLLQDCGKQPIVLRSFDELEASKNDTFGGIVISTSVSSTLDASFEVVLDSVLKNFKGTPILLPTLADSEKVKKTLKLSLSKMGANYDLVSVAEASTNKIELKNKLLIIEKKNITASYDRVVGVMKRFFN